MSADTCSSTTRPWYATARSRIRRPAPRPLASGRLEASRVSLAGAGLDPSLERIGDLPRVHEPHAFHRLCAAARRTERVSIQIRYDLDPGLLGEGLGQLGTDVGLGEDCLDLLPPDGLEQLRRLVCRGLCLCRHARDYRPHDLESEGLREIPQG